MKHFTLQELTYSATARKMNLDNAPTEEHRRNLEEMIDRLIDPLREAWAVLCANEHWGTPALTVSSGYRGYRLNKAVGGSATSAHCVGWAAPGVQVVLPGMASGQAVRSDDFGKRGCRRNAPLGAYRV